MFLNCIYSSRVVGPSWSSVSSSTSSVLTDGHFLLGGNTLTFGCNHFGWKEGAIGTLSRHSRKDCDILQQEITTLISTFGNLSSSLSFICFGQAHKLTVSDRDLLSIFYSLNLTNLNSSHERMDCVGENAGLADLKENPSVFMKWWLLESWTVGRQLKKLKNIVDVVGYTSYQISNHDARIDDTQMNLKKIMGKVDRI